MIMIHPQGGRVHRLIGMTVRVSGDGQAGAARSSAWLIGSPQSLDGCFGARTRG